MKRILLLGLTSNTGFKFYIKFKNTFYIHATYRKLPKSIHDSINFIQINDYSKETLKKIIQEIKPDIIINTVTEGNLDKCEENYNIAEKLNFTLVKDIVNLIKNRKIKLIHFSSNAVYDGKNAPYSEQDKQNPINKYGKLKLASDNYIKENLNSYLLLRPITMIGYNEKFQRTNPAMFIINSLLSNKKY